MFDAIDFSIQLRKSDIFTKFPIFLISYIMVLLRAHYEIT